VNLSQIHNDYDMAFLNEIMTVEHSIYTIKTTATAVVFLGKAKSFYKVESN